MVNESDSAHTLSRTLIVVLVLAALLAFALRVVPQPRTIDDAFITFRYSRNLVDGEGFVYNTGSRTLGTTTPLYTLLLAGVSLLTGSDLYPWLALWINALADAVTVILLGLLLFRISGRVVLAGVIGVLWAISPMSVTFAVGGMETSVAVLFSVAAAWAYFEGRGWWMALFSALGVLTRIDAALWVGPLFLHQAYIALRAALAEGRLRNWRSWVPWRDWLTFAVVVIPWHIFSLAYFGTLFSRSAAAKRVAYDVAPLHALTRLLQHIATPFLEHETLGIPGIVIGIFLYPALAAVGTLFVLRQKPRLLPFVLYPWIYVVAFSVANPLIFRWYLAPPLPAYFVAIVLGLWALGGTIAESVKRPQALPVGVGIVGVLWALLSLNAWVLEPDHGPDRPAPDMAWHEIELNYRVMGEMLRDEFGTTPETVVAAGDIGAVGYYSHAHILDTVGLITPEIIDYYPLDEAILVEGENYAVPPAIVLDYQPQFIVFMENFVANGLAQDPAFVAQYEIVHEIATDYYGGRMILYQRRD